MKSGLKSALIRCLGGAAFALILAACGSSDVQLPHVFGGAEVPPAVLNEPRVVETPPPDPGLHQTWPRLGDVPSKPDNFSSPAAINQAITGMENERSEGQAIEQRYDEDHQ